MEHTVGQLCFLSLHGMTGNVVADGVECGPVALLGGDMLVAALSTNPRPDTVLHTWHWTWMSYHCLITRHVLQICSVLQVHDDAMRDCW